MKHYLLTWYGITDLRAALGFEATAGPILSALKAGGITDVIILAYTNPAKDPNAFTDDLRAKWEKLRQAELETRLLLPRNEVQEIVDAVNSTKVGHTLFVDWVKKELALAGVSCHVQFIPQELKHLNDAMGIYHAAVSALKLALGNVEAKTLTVFVSPGTPVMAYTWALLARANPQHRIDIIASSDPRKLPEKIELPKDLLMPVLVAPQTAKPSEYDVVFHLLGRERMPIYFGMLQFPAKEHIFITTRDFSDGAKVLSRSLPDDCKHKIVTIRSPFDPNDTRKAIEKQFYQLTSETKISVNLTGGTKLMFAGALSACWELGLDPFYFEISDHNVIFIRDGVTIPFVGAKSVADFFIVNGFNVVKQGRWEDNPYYEERLDVTQKMWGARYTLGDLYQNPEFRKYKIPSGNKRHPPFDWKWKKSQASLTSTGETTLILNDETVIVPNHGDFAQYISGGWMEEYTFALLRQLEQQGLIHDLRIGLEVDYAEKNRPVHANEMPVGEFDCVFTDGKRLWIVECKAGAVKQEHIQKLENNLKTYGGIAAKGLLVSSFPMVPALEKRISMLPSIQWVHPNQLNAKSIQGIIFR